MKKRFAAIIGMTTILSMSVFGAIASAATDFTQFGFPHVVAKKEIKAGEAEKISHSGIKIEIPEGTFNHDVRLEVLEGDNHDFQANSPAGETVIMNFALE